MLTLSAYFGLFLAALGAATLLPLQSEAVLAGLLRRFGHPMTLERMRQLEAAVEQPQRPRLHLVHG